MNYLTSNNLENNNQSLMDPKVISNFATAQILLNNIKLEEKIIEVYQDNFIKEIRKTLESFE